VVATEARGYGDGMNLGPTELIIVLVIVLVLFGGAKLPKLAKSLGEAQREFKKGTDEVDTGTPGTTASVVEPTADKPADSGPVV
jgi:sec-independent protein translocase protein TatA